MNDLKNKTIANRDYMRRYMYIYRLKGNIHYQKKKHYLNQKIKCPNCVKCISRQNMKRHIKTQHHN